MSKPADKLQCYKCGNDTTPASLGTCQCKAKQVNETAPPRELFVDTRQAPGGPALCYNMDKTHSDFFTKEESWHLIEAAPVLAMIEKLEEALTMGAFHHNSCPWLDGKECCCAKTKVDKALAELATFRGLTNGSGK